MLTSVYFLTCVITTVCYGFVLTSSTDENNEINLFQVGESLVYQLHSTVLMNEISDVSKNVGFLVTGDIIVNTLWGAESQKILKFEFRSPQLYVRSQKSDGFIQHSSLLESFSLQPFYVIWSSGLIEKIYFSKEDSVSMKNLKKGIAGLFQFQVLDGARNETDVSGDCHIRYQSLDSQRFQKLKTDCKCSDSSYHHRQDPILDATVKSSRTVTYEMSSDLSHLKHIYSKELHQMILPVREDIGSFVKADQILSYAKSGKCGVVRGTNVESVTEIIVGDYIEDSLVITREEISDDSKTLANIINECREGLAARNLGKLVSAKSFLRVIEVAKKSSKEEIVKVLGGKKNQKILSQIYDILGYVQTEESHAAVLKKLYFEREDHADWSERYLWALSVSPNTNSKILRDLFDRYRKNDHYPEKVKETLILTIASMTRSLSVVPEERKIVQHVEEVMFNSLANAKGTNRLIFLRALKNLKSPSSISILLNIINKGTVKEGVFAFKALKSMNPSLWDANVLSTARRTFLQLDKKYDSSSRTLALDILLESEQPENILSDVLYFMKGNDTSLEVKQYAMQRLYMIANENTRFKEKLFELISSDPSLNNYCVLSPKGLSTALRRQFTKHSSANGSLLTVQEMSGGIVKRGIVNVMMEKNGFHKELFSLGIFASGLSNLMGGDSESDEETTTAGMELTLLDTQIRPFVFFNSQGELMGHVWSGTASERTTALQLLVLLQDSVQYVTLGSGIVGQFSLKGAMSFDLSGNIEISIWSRTAESLVEKSAGIITKGLITVDASFIRSEIEFIGSIEPKLQLRSDIDFSGSMSLCMRLSQEDCSLRYNVFKSERIHESSYKVRLSKYKQIPQPGVTFSLNKKNNEMCSAMFK